MQIVIDIDENLYTRLFDNGVDNYDDAVDMAKAICKGTPLPKGHGNLIERNKVFNALHCFYAHDALDIVCNLPVIIEADKEE